MKGFIVLVILLSTLPPVFSQEVIQYDASLTMDGGLLFFGNPGEIEEKITMIFRNSQDNPLIEVSYPFSAELVDLRVSDTKGEISFSTTIRSGTTYVTVPFREPLQPDDNQTLIYHYKNEKSIQGKAGNTFILTSAQFILANVKNFKMVVFLPAGYVLSEEGTVPTSKDILSDGRSMILIWEMLEPIPAELKGNFKVVIFYERVGWYPTILHVFLFLLSIGIVAFLFYKKRKGHDSGILENNEVFDKIDILKEDEQSILRIIIENNGIDQREITRSTGFSKAKVSKILAELEKRGAIRKEQYGRRNKIFLTDKIKGP